MKRILLSLLLFCIPIIANGMGTIAAPAPCPGGVPPALAATGTSPDGPVCLGQSVRDTNGDVWRFVSFGSQVEGYLRGGFAAGSLTLPGGGVFNYPSFDAQYSALRATSVRLTSGHIEIAIAGSGSWLYFERAGMVGWWPVGQPLPARGGPPAPPGTR